MASISVFSLGFNPEFLREGTSIRVTCAKAPWSS